jgi:hypothetical protein
MGHTAGLTFFGVGNETSADVFDHQVLRIEKRGE